MVSAGSSRDKCNGDTPLRAKQIGKYKGTETATPNFAYAMFAKRLCTQARAVLATPNESESAVFPGVAQFTRVCAYDRPGTLQFDGALTTSTRVPQPTTAQTVRPIWMRR